MSRLRRLAAAAFSGHVKIGRDWVTTRRDVEDFAPSSGRRAGLAVVHAGLPRRRPAELVMGGGEATKRPGVCYQDLQEALAALGADAQRSPRTWPPPELAAGGRNRTPGPFSDGVTVG